MCEKSDARTEMRRLKQDDLAVWLERYRLGELWRSGETRGQSLVRVKIYVEGGPGRLEGKCRRGFREFLEKAGLKDRMPSIIACGGRDRAYDRFCTAQRNAHTNEFIILLVDSEEGIEAGVGPWGFP